MRRAHHVQFGPSIPIVPVTHFSKMRLTEQQWSDVWQIIGPSVNRNMDKVPTWKLIAAAYLEGLQHGAGLQKSMAPMSGAVYL